MKNTKIIKVIVILLIIILFIILGAIFRIEGNDSNTVTNINNEIAYNQINENSILSENATEEKNTSSTETQTSKAKYDLNSLEEGGADIVYNYETAENVSNATYFYTVQNCLTNYLDNLDSINNSDDDEEEDIDSIKNEILNQLAKDYIKKENISKSNIEELAKNTENLKFITITKMLQYMVENSNVVRYVAHTLFVDEKNDVKYLNFIIYFDYVNKTYEIEPTIDTITDIKVLNLNKEINSIESNDNNKVNYDIINTKELLVKYTKAFRDMCMYASSVAYEYLDEEYKNNNFNSLAEFRKYISENKANISKMSLDDYNLIKKENDSNSYYCTDSNNNNYIINASSIMNFSIKLGV